MSRTRILVVDDEPSVLKFLRVSLGESGYDVSTAIDGLDAIDKLNSDLPNLIISDINMPNMNGFELCRRVREWSSVPIIILTARAEQSDIIKAFNLGADDYLLKPFSVAELDVRVKAVLRRSNPSDDTAQKAIFKAGKLTVDFASRQVSLNGKKIELTPTEYSLLKELATNADKVMPAAQLLSRVWGPEYHDEREYLHVFIGRLRSKLDSMPAEPGHIVTVSGVGYQLNTAS